MRKILTGTPVREAADRDSLANPDVLAYFAPGPHEGGRLVVAAHGGRSFGEEGGRLTYGTYLRLRGLLDAAGAAGRSAGP